MKKVFHTLWGVCCRIKIMSKLQSYANLGKIAKKSGGKVGEEGKRAFLRLKSFF